MPVNMAGGRRTDCVERPFSLAYARFGRLVGTHPWCFFVVPVLVSCCMAGGFAQLWERVANDIEEQFTPTDGPGKLERRFVEQHFPVNGSVFSAQRLYTDGVFASVVAVSRSGGDIFSDGALREILSLDQKVRRISVALGHENLTFDALCARKYNKCVPNKILDVIRHYGTAGFGEAGGKAGGKATVELTFPFFRFGFSHVFLGYSVGGVNASSGGGAGGSVSGGSRVVRSAKAVRLFYFLREFNRSATDLWLSEFLRVFPSNLSTQFIKV